MGCAWSELEECGFKDITKDNNDITYHDKNFVDHLLALQASPRTSLDTATTVADVEEEDEDDVDARAFELNCGKLLPCIEDVTKNLITCMKLVLKTKQAREQFRLYLKQLHVGAELAFWLEVESLRDMEEESVDMRAMSIYQRYLAPQAVEDGKRNNWKSRLRTSLSMSQLARYDSNNDDGIKRGPDMESIKASLVQAQELVVNMLAQSHFASFLVSERGKALLETLRRDDETYKQLVDDISVQDIPETYTQWLRRVIDLSANLPISVTIADMTKRDNPLIYCNKAFEAITLFSVRDAFGRNCRFLQGEKTEQENVQKIRRALKDFRPVDVRLTNYRKDGKTFLNFLALRPVFAAPKTMKRSPSRPCLIDTCSNCGETPSIGTRFSCPCNCVAYCTDDCMEEHHEKHMKTCSGRGQGVYFLGVQFDVSRAKKNGNLQLDLLYLDSLISMLPRVIGGKRVVTGVRWGETEVHTFNCSPIPDLSESEALSDSESRSS